MSERGCKNRCTPRPRSNLPQSRRRRPVAPPGRPVARPDALFLPKRLHAICKTRDPEPPRSSTRSSRSLKCLVYRPIARSVSRYVRCSDQRGMPRDRSVVPVRAVISGLLAAASLACRGSGGNVDGAPGPGGDSTITGAADGGWRHVVGWRRVARLWWSRLRREARSRWAPSLRVRSSRTRRSPATAAGSSARSGASIDR